MEAAPPLPPHMSHCCQIADGGAAHTHPGNLKTKIPSPAPAVPGADLDARLAEKLRLRTQISPSRIPRCSAATEEDRALIPTHNGSSSTQQHRRHHHQRNEHNEQHQQQQCHQQPRHASQHAKKVVSASSQSTGKLPNLHKQPPHHCSEQTPRQQEQQEPLQPWSTQRQDHQQQICQQRQHKQHAPAVQHGTQPHSNSGYTVHTSPAVSGMGASRKLHEFLLAQQHKREQYWLSKYGKLLRPAAPASVGKPCPNPASLYRHPANSIRAGKSNPVKLPLLPISQGHASSSTSAAVSAGQHSRCSELPLLSSGRSALPEGKDSDADSIGVEQHLAAGQDHASSSSGPCHAQQQQQQWQLAEQQGQQECQLQEHQLGQCLHQAQQDQEEDEAFQRLLNAKVALASVPKLSVTTTCSAVRAAAAASSIGTGLVRGCGSGCGEACPSGQLSRQLPCRDLEAELQVLRAIKAREDALEKLKACCSRLGADLGAEGRTVLLLSDPLGRLFYRLVASLRLKTLDMVEAHAAWARKVSALEPFTYKGRPYLAALPEGLGFLDAAPWLAGRLLRCKAVEDVLLAEVTPDGVPLDDVMSFDMRRGPGHFSPEALRIRMARKVLAAAGVEQPPHVSNCLAAATHQQQQQQQRHAHSPTKHHQSTEEDWLEQPQHLPGEQQHVAAAAAAVAALGILTARQGALSGCKDSNDVNSATGLPPCSGAVDGAGWQQDFTQWEPQREPNGDKVNEEHFQAGVVAARMLDGQQQQRPGGEHQAREEQQLLLETAADEQQPLRLLDGLPLTNQPEQAQQRQPEQPSMLHQQPPPKQQAQQHEPLQPLQQHEPLQPLQQHEPLQPLQQQQRQEAFSVDKQQQDLVVSLASQTAKCQLDLSIDLEGPAAAIEIEDMLQALVASLEGPTAARFAPFTFSYNDWVIDELLSAVADELEQQEMCDHCSSLRQPQGTVQRCLL